jgi:hypothetical protein
MPPMRSGWRSEPFVFFAGYDDLTWAQPGDHLIPTTDGPTLVRTERGDWKPLGDNDV